MYQSGKIVARCSTALSAATTLGAVTLFFIAGLSIRPAPNVKPAESVAAKSAPTTGSESTTATLEQALTPIEQVRALAETIAGPGPAPAAQSSAPQILSPGAPEAAVPQFAKPELPTEWSETEVAAALMQCVNLLAPINAQVVPLAPIRYDDCGTPAPVLLRSVGSKDKVAVDPPMLLNCPMVDALSRWLDKVVQPAARAELGSPVTRIVGSSYACRNLYNLPNERRSQHAFANAVDLPAFFLADGRRVDLASGWGPTHRDLVAGVKLVPIVAKTAVVTLEASEVVSTKATVGGMTVPVKASAGEGTDPAASGTDSNAKVPAPDPLSAAEAKFLRRVHDGACDVFTTVLGPEANDVHRTHLHLDLQQRDGNNICK
jgi:hypothetical protein